MKIAMLPDGPREEPTSAWSLRLHRGPTSRVGQRVISVAYQRIQAGRHLAGQIVNVRIEPPVLHVPLDGELI